MGGGLIFVEMSFKSSFTTVDLMDDWCKSSMNDSLREIDDESSTSKTSSLMTFILLLWSMVRIRLYSMLKLSSFWYDYLDSSKLPLFLALMIGITAAIGDNFYDFGGKVVNLISLTRSLAENKLFWGTLRSLTCATGVSKELELTSDVSWLIVSIWSLSINYGFLLSSCATFFGDLIGRFIYDLKRIIKLLAPFGAIVRLDFVV